MTSTMIHYRLEELLGYTIPEPRERQYMRLAMTHSDSEIRELAEEMVEILGIDVPVTYSVATKSKNDEEYAR